MKRVLVLSNVSELSPAFRYRILNTLQLLENEKKIRLEVLCFYSNKTMKVLGGLNQIAKVGYAIWDAVKFFNRLRKLKKNYDAVIVKSNIFPVGGGVIEQWCIKGIQSDRWIYDIDDAIYLNMTRKENKVFSRFRNLESKVGFWISQASNVMISNEIIYDDLKKIYGLNRDKCSFFLSAPYRSQYFLPDESVGIEKDPYRFVWLGSPHTQHELRLLDKLVHEIRRYLPDAVIVLIGTNEVFGMYQDISWVKFVDWTPEREISEMRRASFGLNPLYNENFQKRKSAFKVIQYYRAGIIPLVSDVGINRDLIQRYGGYCTKNFQDLDNLFEYVKRMISNIDYERDLLMRRTESLSVETNARLIKNILESEK